MMLIEQTTVPGTALPVAEFKDHLRLGTGFADDGVQDELLEACLRAALSSVEAQTGKALLARSFRWSVTAWRDLSAQVLPIAPVSAITALEVHDRRGGVEVVDSGRFVLEPDTHRPRLVARGFTLPVIPVGGTAEIAFDAGFGATWADLPGDLRQAVFLLAAHFYENRGAASASGADMPTLVVRLIARWKALRLFGGGRP